MSPRPPLVSIVLPTYNRARFLPAAFASVRGQTFEDWELIVVDDGSTDDSARVISAEASATTRPVRSVRQDNAGPAAARNTGLRHARGRFVAFFDSDDRWLPHHLAECVAAFDADARLDWVYASTRIVTVEGTMREPDSFRTGGRDNAFLSLATRPAGRAKVIDDADAARVAVEAGLYCGLQVSVFRREAIAEVGIPDHRVGEDRVLPVLFLRRGLRIGYLDAVHAEYLVHDDNSSATGTDAGRSRHAMLSLAGAYAALMDEADGDAALRRAVARRVAHTYFWLLGYALYRDGGHRLEAFRHFRAGLRAWPWDWRMWKTYLVVSAASRFGTAPGVSR